MVTYLEIADTESTVEALEYDLMQHVEVLQSEKEAGKWYAFSSSDVRRGERKRWMGY
jgi:hypothetical protein